MMRTCHLAFLPASVRYDRALSSTSILLYGEISAASNAWGVCEENTGYFSAALAVEPRTITRCVAQLLENGHLQRVEEAGKRKLRLVMKPLPLPENTETVESEPIEDLSGFTTAILGAWEKNLETTLDGKDSYGALIRQRLATFDKEEVQKAINNRLEYVGNSPWHKMPENRQNAVDISLVLGNDDNLRKWLNAKPVEPVKLYPMER